MGSTRKCLIRLLALLMTLALFFPIRTARAKSIGDSIVIGIQSSKTLLVRPFEPVERDILSAYNIVYESLVTIDDNYYPQGCLAQSWDVSSNGKSWTFYLRQDVTFSDGTPLTAKDVVASAEYILAKANDEYITDHGFYANLKYFVSSISAKDDYTVLIKAKRPCYGLLYEMIFPVVPEAYVNQDNPPGSGPYIITEFHAGERMWLSANPKWWKAQPQVKEILFLFHDTARSLMDSYEFAQVDAIFTRSIAGTQYKTNTNSLALSYRTNQLECLYMNNNSNEMTYEVRKAIRLLIDKSKIISNAYSGLAVAANFPFYPGTWMYNDGLDSMFSRDVEQARRLLAEAGWEDTDDNGILDYTDGQGDLHNLHLTFLYYEEPDNDVRADAADIIAAALTEVGISVTITPLNMSDLKSRLHSGRYDIALVAFAMDPCPDPGFMLMKGNTGNYCFYKSERMNDLCNELRKQVTPEDYRTVLMQIQAQFEKDCPFVCLYWRTGNVLSRFMYTTCRDIREYELLRGIDSFTVK